MKSALTTPPVADIDDLIVTVRQHRVILAPALATIYGVPTKALNQAVKRNAEKFPTDFMYQLSREEAEALLVSRSQIVTLKRGQNIKYLPYAFTEHGAIMAANVLNSPQATQMSVFVVRAFVKMRSAFGDTRELARKLVLLEQELKMRLNIHEAAIVDALHRPNRLRRKSVSTSRTIRSHTARRKRGGQGIEVIDLQDEGLPGRGAGSRCSPRHHWRGHARALLEGAEESRRFGLDRATTV